MSLGVDYSYAPPTIAELKAAGVTFVARYLSTGAPGTGKNLGPTEAAALKNAAINPILVWENSPSAALAGFKQGATDATVAQSHLLLAGMSPDSVIYFAVDFDATTAQMPTVLDYLKGVVSVIGKNRTGVYGSYSVVKAALDAAIVTYAWQTYAWSRGLWDSRAHIQQYSNNQKLGSGTVDYDRSMQVDYGQTPMTAYTVLPGCLWRPLGDPATTRPIMPRLLIFHTMVGNLSSVERMWKPTGYTRNYSTFGVGGPWSSDGPLDGVAYQWQSMYRANAANWDANTISSSIETADGGDPTRPWSDKQVQTLIRMTVDWCRETGIPCVMAKSWDGFGIGYHEMFLQWNYSHHGCPGNVRENQLRNVIVPKAAAILSGKVPSPTPTPTPTPGVNVTLDSADVAKIWGFYEHDDKTLATMLEAGYDMTKAQMTVLQQLVAGQDAVIALLKDIAASVKPTAS